MTNVKCGSTINAPLSQKTSMKIYKIQIVHGFVKNVTSSIFRIHSFLINYTWKNEIDLLHCQRIVAVVLKLVNLERKKKVYQ